MPTERRLSDLADEVHLSEEPQAAPVPVSVPVEYRLSSLADEVGLHQPPFHERVAGEVLRLFQWSVVFTAVLTLILVGIDTVGLWRGIIHPAERLVTEKVLLALIGATVVQVGAASAAIVYGLFKKKPEDEPPRPSPRRRRARQG